jgi:hypothetical protein
MPQPNRMPDQRPLVPSILAAFVAIKPRLH